VPSSKRMFQFAKSLSNKRLFHLHKDKDKDKDKDGMCHIAHISHLIVLLCLHHLTEFNSFALLCFL